MTFMILASRHHSMFRRPSCLILLRLSRFFAIYTTVQVFEQQTTDNGTTHVYWSNSTLKSKPHKLERFVCLQSDYKEKTVMSFDIFTYLDVLGQSLLDLDSQTPFGRTTPAVPHPLISTGTCGACWVKNQVELVPFSHQQNPRAEKMAWVYFHCSLEKYSLFFPFSLNL